MPYYITQSPIFNGDGAIRFWDSELREFTTDMRKAFGYYSLKHAEGQFNEAQEHSSVPVSVVMCKVEITKGWEKWK